MPETAKQPPLYSDKNRDQLVAAVLKRDREVKLLSHELAWYKRQLFGEKSEKRFINNPNQLGFDDGLFTAVEKAVETPKQTITYQRSKGPKQRPEDCVTETGLRFDSSVPVKTIHLKPEGIDGLGEDEYEIIGVKKTHRIAQRPASTVVLCYERPVVKILSDGAICQAPAPSGVLERSIADVSFIAGMLVDKYEYHLPLHRQHLRLKNSGITLARSTLTNLSKQAIELLRPIVDAQLLSVLESSVLAMDETPVKAGLSKKRRGKMKQGYFWPVYGERDELVFTFAPSRGMQVIEKLLREHFSGTLLTDGYSAYAAWVDGNERVQLAQCWSHTRREFFEARAGEADAVDHVLELIGKLYRIETDIKTAKLEGEDKRHYRLAQSKPIVDEIFAWHWVQNARPELIPQDPLKKALNYLGKREQQLRLFLAEPALQLDTNHIERGLRRIPLGRKNWMFCWTELGAEHVGIIQSLIATCRLHDVNPYTYLVDVLQRVSIHPASEVADLTPRRWKTLFADNPLRSDLYDSG